MRQLERERRGVWFAKYLDKEPIVDTEGHRTGEYRLTYGKPFRFEMTVSPRTGNTWGDGFGIGVDCDRTALVDRVGTGIDETCIAWVDIRPKLNDDGSLAYGDDGQMVVQNDYKVVMVGESYNFTNVAIKKVE